MEQRALVADLVRTQRVLQARSEQLQEIFASRWYRLARFAWRLRRGSVFRKAAPAKMAGEESFAQPLDSITAEMDRQREMDGRPAGPPVPGLESAGPGPGSSEPIRLLIAGHSLSFCDGIAEQARQRGAVVREDRWRAHGTHDDEASAAALGWADVVHCEWCLGNAVWYSRNKRPQQRLVVRFHRMELETSYPGEVDLKRIDAMVFVARHVLEQACEKWGWDPDDPRFQVLSNGVDPGPLRLPKLPGAQFTLATIGYVPRLKRLDRALDVLELLRAHDDRYRLAVKGREPWEYPWMVGREEDRSYFEELSRRLEQSPGLRGAVAFDPFGDDVPAFLQKAGWILSTSEVEGDSVSLAEGMASGAIPVIFARPGAAEQYEERWVHGDAAGAARAILATAAHSEVEAEGAAAQTFSANWDRAQQESAWARLLQVPPDRTPSAPAART
ncbi:MAG TPA: glycosyltransferase [Solirubrobacterales bacterium]|nr:glycosyltransferase [Solirubrobacterales bacterium]